jgi:hypothetical protein
MSNNINNVLINHSLNFCFPESSSKERQDIRGSSDKLLCQPCSSDAASDVAYTSGANKNVAEFETQNTPTKECGSDERKTVSESETVETDDCVAQRKNCRRTEMPDEHCMQQEVVRDLALRGNNLVMKPELRLKPHKGAGEPHWHEKKHRHHRRKHSHREEKGAIFEGERVSYLVGQCEAKEGQTLTESGEQSSGQDDDYVLRKLFKKSGESFHT